METDSGMCGIGVVGVFDAGAWMTWISGWKGAPVSPRCSITAAGEGSTTVLFTAASQACSPNVCSVLRMLRVSSRFQGTMEKSWCKMVTHSGCSCGLSPYSALMKEMSNRPSVGKNKIVSPSVRTVTRVSWHQ